jgi:hypothetical protein
MTKLTSGTPLNMPAFRYMATLRRMPTSKHSNSGCVPLAAITSRNCLTLATGLSNTIGGQAHSPLSLIFR